jgi:hypothetical protein
MKTFFASILLAGLSIPFPVAQGANAAPPAAAAEQVFKAKSHTRKPTLPVSLQATLPDHIAAGENLTLDVGISSTLQQGELVVAFIPDEGLALVSPQQAQQFTLSGGLFKTTIPLTVVPSQDGRYAVTVEFRHIDNGRERGVARGITFRVGDKPAVAAKARAASSADNVISMPAQETIIRQ